MVNTFRNYFAGAGILMSSLLFSQQASFAKQYPSMYENQVANNLPSVSSASTEKVVLSAKELVDININSMMDDPVLKNAKWGFVIYDPKTKKIVSSHNENSSLIPASTTKLLTTETAMNLLGEKFRWNTQLEYSGEIDENGVLNGNLYIVGSGDPSLGTGKAGASSYRSITEDYIYAIADKGIKKVNGNIVIQTAVFKENKMAVLPENIVWLDTNNYYLPVGSTKNINPANERLIVKKATPMEKSKKFFYVSPYAHQTVYAEKFEGLPLTTKIADAPYTLANTLRTTLIKKGISVSGKVESKMTDLEPEQRFFITVYRSPTIGDIVHDTNQRSDNALAEATLRMLGFQKKGDQTLNTGREVVLEHLRDVNFDLAGLNYADGSGLSRNHTVTPIAQVKYLSSLLGEKYYKSYFESLPIGGQSGTLKKMFLGNGYGQVFAKTGTLNGVKTLAGYLKTHSGKTLVFSLLINNYSGSVDMVKLRMERLLEPALNL